MLLEPRERSIFLRDLLYPGDRSYQEALMRPLERESANSLARC